MPSTTVGGLTISYETHGDSGDWVTLIMGWGYGMWGWEPVVEPLARDFRVLVFDNRGVGGTDAPAGPYTAEMLADDAIGLARTLGISRTHLIGTSGGGFYAMEAAIAQPDLIDHLVIAASPLPGPAGEWMPIETVQVLAEVAGLPEDERYRRLVANALSEGYGTENPEEIDRIVKLRLETAMPIEAWEAQRQANLSYVDPERPAKITQPALVTAGTDDRVVSFDSSRRLAEAIPDARFEAFEGAGHLHFWEQPERFVDVVSAFLRGGA